MTVKSFTELEPRYYIAFWACVAFITNIKPHAVTFVVHSEVQYIYIFGAMLTVISFTKMPMSFVTVNLRFPLVAVILLLSTNSLPQPTECHSEKCI